MRNTFRYALSFEDFLSFEMLKVKLKRGNVVLGLLLILVTAMLVYNAVKNSNIGYAYFVYYGIFVAIDVIMLFYNNKIAPKKAVNKYINRDSSYLEENEITFDDKALEIKNIPNEKQAGIVCIYPYSVMGIIYETEEHFYFSVGSEVKILPKRVIPNEMKEAVFKSIKSNPNCIFVK